MQELVVKDRYRVVRNEDFETPFYEVWDRFDKAPVSLGFEDYKDARLRCNNKNQRHLEILKWSLRDAQIAIQIQLEL